MTGMSRRSGVGLEMPQNLIAVQLGHHDVEEQQVESLRPDHLQGLAPVLGGGRRIALAPESAGEHVAVDLVVVDDEQAAPVRQYPSTVSSLQGRLAAVMAPRIMAAVSEASRWGAVSPASILEKSATSSMRKRKRSAARADLLRSGIDICLTEGFCLFQQQLAVADDGVDRRSQVVSQVGPEVFQVQVGLDGGSTLAGSRTSLTSARSGRPPRLSFRGRGGGSPVRRQSTSSSSISL